MNFVEKINYDEEQIYEISSVLFSESRTETLKLS